MMLEDDYEEELEAVREIGILRGGIRVPYRVAVKHKGKISSNEVDHYSRICSSEECS